MVTSAAYAFSAALVQGERVRHRMPLAGGLVRRLCRAAHLEGIRRGFLAPDAPGRAWLAPAGGRRCRGSGGSDAIVVDALTVVVRVEEGSFARELPTACLLPWARPLADGLARDETIAADSPVDLWLLAEPADGATPVDLPPYRLYTAPEACPSVQPLQPDLADDAAVPVWAAPSALASALTWCRQNPAVERAGVLLGSLAWSPAEGLFVDARHFSPAVDADEQAATVRFTRASWQAIHRHRLSLDPALQVVAWVHSHPCIDLGDGRPTAHFLSAVDLEIMAAFFDLPHCTAWVVDTGCPDDPAVACAVFGWDRAGVGVVRRTADVVLESLPSREESGRS